MKGHYRILDFDPATGWIDRFPTMRHSVGLRPVKGYAVIEMREVGETACVDVVELLAQLGTEVKA